MKEARHKRIYTVSFHLHEVQEGAKLIYGSRSWERDCLWQVKID